MPFLRPSKDWMDWWEHRLSASGGRRNYEIIIYEDDSVEIAVDYLWMGIPNHRYYLYGDLEKLSETYGRVHISQVRKAMPTESGEPDVINLTDFEGAIVFEYFYVTRSPHLQHPHDMLVMAQAYGANWNDHFNVLFVLLPFVQETIDSLRWMYENPSEDYEPPDINSIDEVAKLLAMLDKCKFERIEKKENQSTQEGYS
ncbi:MAG: hypothetical protein KC708_23100 [Anaerolineae bacterium]|nr:hypothetical protein [Anaerolineae bacterium]